MRSLLLRFLFVAGVLLFGTSVTRAVTQTPYTLMVGFSSRLTGTGSGTLTVYGEATATVSSSVSGGPTESAIKDVSLRPGKSYPVNFSGNGPSAYNLSFTAPDGYSVYLDGVPMDLLTRSGLSGTYSHDYSLQLLPAFSNEFMPAGAFSGIDLGKSVAWDVGLGSLVSGRGAGRISFREFDLNNNPVDRARLYYTPPTNVGEVTVVKVGQVLRQIRVPQTVVDLVDDATNGYWFKFYTLSQATWSGSLYTFTGSPWRTIRVESPGASQLTITETEGSVSQLHKLRLTSVPAAPVASGGVVSDNGGYRYHKFTGSSSFVITNPSGSSFEALIVAGGGSGGCDWGGGGGAGGARLVTGLSLTAGTYPVVVGAGGAQQNSYGQGNNGGNSSVFGYTSFGGGGGGYVGSGPGQNGGSGGGGGGHFGTGTGVGGTGSQGGAGGTSSGTGVGSAGGGGMGGAGYGGTTTSDGYGGPAATYWGASYSGGGGGGSDNTKSNGGGGGGGAGDGSNGSGDPGGAAAANSGSGGGGGGSFAGPGGAGGSGVVLVRYSLSGGSGSIVSGTYVWELQEGDSTTVARTTTHTSTIPATGQRDDVVVVQTGGTWGSGSSGPVVSKTKYHYVTQAWGEELTQVIADPDTAALTTSYDYWTTNTEHGNYRKVKSVTRPDGDWTAFQYYDTWDRRGQLFRQFSPFLNAPLTVTLSPTTTRMQAFDYTADWTGRYRIPLTSQEYINGTMTGMQAKAITNNQVLNGQLFTIYESHSNLTPSTYEISYVDTIDNGNGYNHPDWYGVVLRARKADGTQVSGMRYHGTYNSSTHTFTVGTGDHLLDVALNGTTDPAGGNLFTSWRGLSIRDIYLIPYKSTIVETVRDPAGKVLLVETKIHTGASTPPTMTADEFTYDFAGRLLTQKRDNNTLVTNTYANGRLASTVDAVGTKTLYTYDSIGRVSTSVKEGVGASTPYAAQADITTTYTYDGANRVKQTVSSGGSLSLTSLAEYDLAGRIKNSTAPGGYLTLFAYANVTNGGTTVTTTMRGTLPSGGPDKIVETYRDGQTKSVTGTAVVEEFFTPGLDGSANRTVAHRMGPSGSTTFTTTTTTDWLGRKIAFAQAKWGGGTATSTWVYNSGGQLVKTTGPGIADTLYEYDTLGALKRQGLDLGTTPNGSLDASGTDRITVYGWEYFLYGTVWARKDTTSIYPQNGSGALKQISEVQNILVNPAGRLSGVISYDIYGNATVTVVDVTPSAKVATTTVIRLASPNIESRQITRNGLGVSATDTAGNTTTVAYDSLGRAVSKVDPRTGADLTVYRTTTSEVEKYYDPYAKTQLPGNSSFQPTSTYHYDDLGRVDYVVNARNKKAYTSYTLRSEISQQWGETTEPVEYAYDAWGRQLTMKTFRGGSSWSGPGWPTSTTGTADFTRWEYDIATGLLKEKYDAANLDSSGNPISGAKKVAYTYNQARQLKTRTWQRGVTTTYYYFGETSGEPVTAELRKVDYGDSTPDIQYTYNRLGNVTTVADPVTGTRTFNYNLSGTLELQNEVLGTSSSDFYDDRRITHGYDTTTSGALGRYNYLSSGSAASPSADFGMSYTYDSYGRLNGAAAFTYTYKANSNLIESVSRSGFNYTDTRTYDPYRDWITSRTTSIGSTVKGAFTYTQDLMGRITDVARTGEIFSRYGDGSEGLKIFYGYDERSQLTSERTELRLATTPLTGRNDLYTWDTFGNRSSSSGTTHNTNAADYTTNSLNQYTQRVVPGVFDVSGAAATTATVTVNTSPSGISRHGEYFFKGQAMSNSSSPAYSVLNVSDGGTPVPWSAFKAKTPEPFSYDDDGNLTRDGRWVYQYDAENRLVTMFTRGAPDDPEMTDGNSANDAANTAVWTSGLAQQKLIFSYDYLGRRVSKHTASYTGSVWLPDAGTRFVYDGWNLILEIKASDLSRKRYHVWGLDISGTLTGAGGVGGLLHTYDYLHGGFALLPVFDGNGNVYGYIKHTDGSLVAGFEYDAFGNTVRESGSSAADAPLRFSTKYTDVETGLVYYGLRYYSPTLGRFINKDPIEERGGLNLYGFCGNNGVNGWDNLGMTVSRGRYDVLLDGGGDPRMSGGGSAATLDWAFSTGLAVVKDEMDSVMNSAHPSATNSGNWYQNMLAREQEKAIKDALVAASGGSMSNTQAGKLSDVIMQYGWDAVIATATIANQASSPTTPAKNDVPTATTTPGRTIDLTFGFEQGVSDKSVAETQAQAFQALLNKYTNLTGEPSVVIQAHYSANPVDHPRSGVWSTLASDEPYNAIAAYTPAGGFGVLIASSVMKNERAISLQALHH